MKEQYCKKNSHIAKQVPVITFKSVHSKGKVSFRGAPGGAVKQLAFDSTTPAKTNMADEGGRADSNVYWWCSINVGGAFRAWSIDTYLKKKNPPPALLPGAQ